MDSDSKSLIFGKARIDNKDMYYMQDLDQVLEGKLVEDHPFEAQPIKTFDKIEPILFSAVNYVKDAGRIVKPRFAEPITNRPMETIADREMDLTICLIEGANNLFYRDEWYHDDKPVGFFFDRDKDWHYTFENYGFLQKTTSILNVMYSAMEDAKNEKYSIESWFEPDTKLSKEQEIMLKCLTRGISHLRYDGEYRLFKPRVWKENANKQSNQ